MRVGIDYNAAIAQGGGVGRYTRSLFSELIRLDQTDQFVLYYNYSRGERPPPFFPDARNVVERPLAVPERWLTVLWHRMRIPVPIELVTGPVDVFHFPNFAVPPVQHAATVVTIHDLSFLVHPETAEEGNRLYLEKAVPAAVRAADFVVVDSANTENDLICLLDVDPERVQVVYPAVDSSFRPVEDGVLLGAIRHKYNLNFPYIYHQSVIEPRKNLPRLFEAFSRLKRDLGIPHRLVIGGGLGWMYETVFAAVEDLSLGDSIVFLGRIPDEDLPALYTLADVFAYPSLYEGFGIPPLEAMACGTPVVTSNSSSLPETVGDAGLMARPTDVDGLAEAIAQVLTNQTLRDDLSRRGRERARLFTWEASAEKVLGIYRRLAAKRGR